MIVVGGVVPPQDYDALKTAGAEAIFPPGTVIAEAAEELLKALNQRLGHAQGGGGVNLSCPAIAGKGDHPRAGRWKGRGTHREFGEFKAIWASTLMISCNDNEAAVRRPLHHGSLAARAPVVPLACWQSRISASCEVRRDRWPPAPMRMGGTAISPGY